jgi:hypothetical protein
MKVRCEMQRRRFLQTLGPVLAASMVIIKGEAAVGREKSAQERRDELPPPPKWPQCRRSQTRWDGDTVAVSQSKWGVE